MQSRVMFWRRRRDLAVPALPAPDSVPMLVGPGGQDVGSHMAEAAPPPDPIVAAMFTVLNIFLPPTAPPLPPPGIAVVGVTERAVGIGNRRGNDIRDGFAVTALKGRRLDAVVRFQLWADQPAAATTLINDLQSRLLGARDTLRAAGFLRITAVETSPVEQFTSPAGWRTTADFRVLYEYRTEDTDGAESLIARIPIDLTGLPAELTVVTDEMARWDNQEAAALEVRGALDRPVRVGTLRVLAFLPVGWDGATVKVEVTTAGIVHSHTYNSVRAFVGSLTLDAGNVDLGGNPYVSGHLVFPNANFPIPIVLTGGDAVLRISYSAPAFDHDAVLYLRALP